MIYVLEADTCIMAARERPFPRLVVTHVEFGVGLRRPPLTLREFDVGLRRPPLTLREFGVGLRRPPLTLLGLRRERPPPRSMVTQESGGGDGGGGGISSPVTNSRRPGLSSFVSYSIVSLKPSICCIALSSTSL